MLQSAGGLRWHSGQTAAQEAGDDCSSAVRAFGNLRMSLSRDGRQRWRPVDKGGYQAVCSTFGCPLTSAYVSMTHV